MRQMGHLTDMMSLCSICVHASSMCGQRNVDKQYDKKDKDDDVWKNETAEDILEILVAKHSFQIKDFSVRLCHHSPMK